MYRGIVDTLKGHYGDHQLAVACRSQLKVRTQLSSESLQEFATTIKQLAHKHPLGLLHYFIQREAAYTFINRIRD
jgi:hypothetical protein